MNIKLDNSIPVDFDVPLKKYYPIKSDTNYQQEINQQVQNLVNQIYKPLDPTKPVTLTIDNKQYQADEFTKELTTALLANDNSNSINDQISLVFHSASRYKEPQPDDFRYIIGDTQMLKSNAGFHLPNAGFKYTYQGDIQVPAKDYLLNPTDDNFNKLKYGLLGYLNGMPLTNGWTFIITNKDQYQKIQQKLDTLVQSIQTPNSELTTKNQNIQSIDLSNKDIFTAILTGASQEPLSIQRLLQQAILESTTSVQTDPLPLNLQGLYSPIGFAFINPENLANANARTLKNELNQLIQITNRLAAFKHVRINTIKNAMTNNSSPKVTHNYRKQVDSIQKLKSKGFSTKLPTVKTQMKKIIKLVNKFASKEMSDNTYITTRPTFMRPNRRHPDDIDLRGTLQNTNYRPDIHIYLDTSGSISESQYKTAVTTLIVMAKQLNTNLYFTSFSHIISQSVKLQTKNCNIHQIYRQINMIPKVTGGTEYENVWTMIDKTARYTQQTGQARQLNFIITDFAYDIRNTFTPNLKGDSTKYTFYMPLASTQHDYTYSIRPWALEFANSMIDHGDITIKSRILL